MPYLRPLILQQSIAEPENREKRISSNRTNCSAYQSNGRIDEFASAMIQLFLTALFFVFSFFFGMLGIGGGVIYTPLQLFAGYSFHHAAALSLLLITVTSLSSAGVYIRAQLIDLRLTVLLGCISFSASWGGSFAARFVPERLLIVLFALFLCLNGYLMLKEAKQDAVPRFFKGIILRCRYGDTFFTLPLFPIIAVALFAGAMGGLLGIGGGIFLLPIMILLFGVPVKAAIAVSSFIVGLTGLGGFLGRITFIEVDTVFVLSSLLAVGIGSTIGARRSIAMQGDSLKRILGIAFILLGIMVVVQKVL